jgi:RNA polymerase sigma factor (sigma-70 family)
MKQLFATHSSIEASPAALVQRCLQGDANAWHQLVDRYARLVHSVPARYGLTTAEIEDIGQEVFLALAQNLHTIDDPDRLPAWLVTTARRLCWRMVQRRRREQPLEDEPEHGDEFPVRPELVSPLPTPEEALDGWTRQEVLQSAVARLNERCRKLIEMIFLDTREPSYDEISALLDIPKGSIGPTRNRCLGQLRLQLGEQNPFEDDKADE